MLLIIMFLAIYIPLSICFPEIFNIVFDVIIVVCFLIDILLNLRTTYKDPKHKEVVEPKLIMINYVSNI